MAAPPGGRGRAGGAEPPGAPRSPLREAAHLASGAAGAVGRVARGIGLVVGLADPSRVRGRARWPGAPPGIEGTPDVDVPPPPGEVRTRVVDYAAERIERSEPADVQALLARPRPEWATTRWVDVAGLHPHVVESLRRAHGFHTLAAEDVLVPRQRPKLEPYEDHLFLVARMVRLQDGVVASEQVSAFLFDGLAITFQEREGDVWDPVRARIEKAGSRIRRAGPAYLLYALLDAVVDHYFPVLERYGDRLEELEERIVERAVQSELRELHGIKRDLVMLRRWLWPTRQLLDDLYRGDHELVDRQTRTYLRDAYDHAVRVLELVETYREIAGGLTELYVSSVSNRLNEVMKVLTIIASIFVPITFLAGVYGMNFEHQPEFGWAWAYPAFWAACAVVVVSLLLWFRRKGWIGGS